MSIDHPQARPGAADDLVAAQVAQLICERYQAARRSIYPPALSSYCAASGI